MTPRPAARPFLKWAGGKTQLLGPIAKALPAPVAGAYHEPFLGSGAVFFHLRAEGRLKGGAFLSDANAALVETFTAVRDRVDEVVDRLARHRGAHSAKHYYEVRAAEPRSPVARAARFIYLNKTCYNGLWRVNRAGKFNVPMGRYEDPPILDEPNLRACSEALASVEIRHEGFAAALVRVAEGAVVYLDPPYEPLTTTANFTSYTKERFGRPDQEALAEACAALRDRGAFFLLSNHDTTWLRDLYRARRFSVRSVPARRAINSRASGRGAVRELLITG
jgi:DNA adenine methylase